MSGRTIAEAAAAAPKLLLGLLAFVCVAGLWRAAATIGLHVPFDPNEGWNAYHAVAAMSGASLYPAAPSYMVNNYPPLSFYIVGALGRALGDMIVAGRIVALLSFFAVAACIAQIATVMGCRTIAATLAALLFMACLLVGSDYVGMDDPQMLGHALAMAGVVILLREPRSIAIGAGLVVIALFVKHNLAAAPVALAAWLLLYDRPAGVRFIAAGAALALAGLLAFRLFYGSSLLSHLASSRTYSFALLAENLGQWLAWGAVPLAITAVQFSLQPKDKYVAFCALYASIALVLGIAFSGGAGVDANAFFDADIALALSTGLAFERFSARGVLWPAVTALALVVPLGAGLYLASADEDWRDPDFWAHPMADDAVTARADIAFLKERRGRALCEMLSFCYWAGKRPEVDMFNAEQQFLTQARSDGDLAHEIDAHAFAAVQLESLDPFALTPHIHDALLKAYRIDHSDDEGTFLVPR